MCSFFYLVTELVKVMSIDFETVNLPLMHTKRGSDIQLKQLGPKARNVAALVHWLHLFDWLNWLNCLHWLYWLYWFKKPYLHNVGTFAARNGIRPKPILQSLCLT